MHRVCTIAILLAALTVAGETKKMHPDYVPDERTAERIAEAVLIGQYGEVRVKAQLPLRATNSYKDVWVVQVTEPGPPHKGGGMAVWINKHSGCIENVVDRMK
jgi:hypothetical protein